MEDHIMTPPGLELVGVTRNWRLPGGGNGESDETTLTFHGQYIGMGSSERDGHINHDPDSYAPRGVSCSACRWFEARIFVRESDSRYLVHTVGMSIVDRESPRYGHEWATSPYEVIDKLTTVRRNHDIGVDVPVLSWAARRVLAQAAFYDEDLEDAYTKRIGKL